MSFTAHDPSQLLKRVENDFTYHCPPPEKDEVFQAIREYAKNLANLIVMTVPPGREQASALTRLEECVMHANAGIARRYPKQSE